MVHVRLRAAADVSDLHRGLRLRRSSSRVVGAFESRERPSKTLEQRPDGLETLREEQEPKRVDPQFRFYNVLVKRNFFFRPKPHGCIVAEPAEGRGLQPQPSQQSGATIIFVFAGPPVCWLAQSAVVWSPAALALAALGAARSLDALAALPSSGPIVA
jgi:hypothetical protein